VLPYYHAVRRVARRIAGAIERSTEALRERRIEQESALTERMLGSIEESLEGFRTRGIRWSAKSLTERGPGSQESQYGADFVGVLNVALEDFQVSKGFLVQAKMVRNETVDDVARLKQQCHKMLDMTSHAYVFLYSEWGVRVVPAISVVAAKANPATLYSRSAQRFFENHLECFIGDHAIKSPTPEALKALRTRYKARNALLVAGVGEQLALPKVG
jgi:hypothetical protein